MKKIIIIISIALLSLFMLSGCGSNEKQTWNAKIAERALKTEAVKYIKLTHEEAKEIMDSGEHHNPRRGDTEEYDTGHIEGAVLLPNTEIRDSAEDVLKDKDGRYSYTAEAETAARIAAAELISMGYLQVYDFGEIKLTGHIRLPLSS